jgi:iron complex outermembrane receptor protein
MSATRKFLLTAVSLSALGWTVPALAQDSTADSASEAPAFEEIVVTARRREESAKDAPITITALSGEQLEERGVTAAEDLRRVTPGLHVQGLNRNEVNFNVRGQGPGPSQVGVRSAPGVVSYFAEVPVSIAPGTFYDLANIQILKGPQGTLFGRNTTGGAVLIEPHKATDSNGGYAQVSLGNYDMRQFQGMVNVAPVPGVLAVRVAGSVSRRDGFTRSIITGQKLDSRNYEAFRGTIHLTPGDVFDNETIVSYYSSDNSGSSEVIRNIDPSLNVGGTIGTTPALAFLSGYAAAFGLTADQVAGIPLTVGGGASIGCIAGPLAGCPTGVYGNIGEALRAAYASSVAGNGGLALIGSNATIADILATQAEIGPRRTQTPVLLRSTRRDFAVINRTNIRVSDSLTIKNIFSYSENRSNNGLDFDGTPLSFLSTNFRTDDLWSSGSNTLTEEFQLQGDLEALKLRYIVGAYHEHSWSGFPQAVSGTTLTSISTRFPDGRDESNALFGHIEWNPSPVFGISGGIRHTWDKRRSSISVVNENGECTQTDPYSGEYACPISYGAHFKALTYDATVTVHPTQELLVYASYRRGYKAGGINMPPPPNNALFNPEKVKSLEVGVKADMNVGVPLRIDAAGFLDNYLDRQQTVATNFTNSRGEVTSSFIITNAPKSKIKGFEATATILPVYGLSLTGFVSYLRAYSTTSLPGYFIEGRQFQNQPKWKWGVNGAYTVDLGNSNGKVTLSADWSWQDQTYNTNVPGLVPTYPSYGSGNARIDWRDVMGRPFDLGVFVTNFTNKAAPLGGYPIDTLGFDSVIYNEPRMWGVSLKVRFGDER